MLDALLDALVDTGKLLPILFLTYLLMEYLEHHAGGTAGALPPAVQRSRACSGCGVGLGAPVWIFRGGFQFVCGWHHHHGDASGRISVHLR